MTDKKNATPNGEQDNALDPEQIGIEKKDYKNQAFNPTVKASTQGLDAISLSNTEGDDKKEYKDNFGAKPGQENGKKYTIPTADTLHNAPAKKKKPVLLFVTITVLFIALLALGYLMFFHKKMSEGESKVHQMQELTEEIRGLETEVQQKQEDINLLMDKYKDTTGKPYYGTNPLNLTPEEQKIFEERVKNEQDVTVKALLSEINNNIKEINDLNKQIAGVETMLPKPHIVKEGESHYKIAMDYLVNEKGLDQETAHKLAERTALLDEMVPGFKVWNFYSAGEYGSSVTQGTAKVSPNTLIRRAKKKLVDARDQAVSEKEKLAIEIQELEKRRNSLLQQLDSLLKQKENLISQVTDLDQKNKQMQVTINSLYYLYDTQSNLKKQGILQGGFLKSTKMKSISPQLFNNQIDLRATSQIVINAADLNLSKIRSVSLFPRFHKKGTDYHIQIQPDNRSAYITIMDVAKFKNERVVISVK